MNSEEPKPRRKALKIWIAALCLLVVTGLAIVFAPSDGEAITFRIVDADTGEPVTNVTVVAMERWARLPLEKLRVPGLSSWRLDSRSCETGTISVAKVRRASKRGVGPMEPTINFVQRDYYPAIFLRQDRGHGSVLSLRERPALWITQEVAIVKGLVTIGLDRSEKRGAQP